MAIAWVKSSKIEGSYGTSTSGTVTGTAGNGWVACIGGYEGSTTMSVSGGGTWATDSTENGTAYQSAGLASAPNITGGSQTVTATVTSANGVTCIVHEFSGLATSSMLDGTASPASSDSTSTAVTNSYTNVNASALFVAATTQLGSAVSVFTGTTSGWTYNPSNTDETDGNSYQVIGTGYLIASTTASRNSSWTINSTHWRALLAAYKGAAAPGGVQEDEGLSWLIRTWW